MSKASDVTTKLLKPTTLLIIFAVVLILIGLALMASRTSEEMEEEEKPPAELVEKEEEPEVPLQPLPPPPTQEVQCGDKICNTAERCDEATRSTICPEDCGLSCPAFMIVSNKDNTTIPELKSYFCDSENCEQTGADRFILTGPAKVATYVINIGERPSTDLKVNFFCQDLATQSRANRDGSRLNELTFKDYFGDNKETFVLDGRKSVKYTLEVTPTELAKDTAVNCFITLFSTTEFNNGQGFDLIYKAS